MSHDNINMDDPWYARLINKLIDHWPGIAAGVVSMAVAVGGCLHNQNTSQKHANKIEENTQSIQSVENKADIAEKKAITAEKKIEAIEKKDK